MPKANDRGIFEKDKGSGVWWVRYADSQHHERREVAGTKAQARDLYQRRKNDERTKAKHPHLVTERAVTFGAIANDAMAHCRRHADFGSDEERMKRMLGWWAGMPATSLTPLEIEARFGTMTVNSKRRADVAPKIVSGATCNRYRALLSLTYRLAQRNGRIPAGFNPARLVERRKEADRVRWLSADEERRLRDVLEREYPDGPQVHILDLALNLGLRWGDQAALAANQREGAFLPLRIHKNEEPVNLKLNDIAQAAFDALVSNLESNLPSQISNLKSEIPADARIMPTRSPKHWFTRALRLAGISNFRWHDLRHTFATRMLQAGVPVETVQKLLGHRSITMTLRYAHVVAGYHDDAVDRLAEINKRCATGGATVIPIDRQDKKKEG